jgi:hypothetical protein
MFNLIKENVKLSNVNARTEPHGDEDVLAVDLSLEFETANAVLLKFSPTLRDALYTQDPGATRDMINPEHAPCLRNPQMGEIKWALEMPYVRFSIFADGTNDEEIIFSEAKCNKFHFICKEGGSVLVKFRIQKSSPLEPEVTKLLFLMNKMIKVSLEAEEEPEYTGDAPDTSSSEAKGDQPDATDLFIKGAADQSSGAADSNDEFDFLYERAKEFVIHLNKASISMLKRELKTTPAIATRILDKLVDVGIVSEPNDQGMYDVLPVTA